MQINKGTIKILLISIVGFFSMESYSQQLDPVLKELIVKGLNKSQIVKINSIEAEQANLDQRLARSVFIPKVTLNGSYTRLNDDITFDEDTQNLLVATQKLLIKEGAGLPFNAPFPEGIPLKDTPNLQDKNILKTSLDMDWVLFSGFEVSNAIKASRHKEFSLNYLGMAEKDKIALKIIETYDKLALVYASEKVLTISEKYLGEQEHFINKAIENGLATPIGRKKIELAQQQLAGKQLRFEHNKTLLIEELHRLTGEDRNHLRILHPKLESFNLNKTQTEKRNEIKALEEAEQATIYKSKMEKNHFIPKVALRGHYEFIEDYLSLLDPVWYVGVGIKWNIFDGNQSNLKAKKSTLESQIYRERIEEAEEMINLSIIKAEQTYQATLQASIIVEKEIELASDTYDLTDKQYKHDLASINDVLDALTDLERANFKLQESLFDQRRAVAELLHAKGILQY
ncbi:TolC family protein [Xanthomarina sp.]|uniref:TolC family protein n=1 Tax=Xanthomarina sp. TaxID=1931211 RepID=UPI002B7B64F1|nr:TolC family protein [Xanthomarina sp.]HLV40373.1 TolC family protein [Xanthomarina sp.]